MAMLNNQMVYHVTFISIPQSKRIRKLFEFCGPQWPAGKPLGARWGDSDQQITPALIARAGVGVL